METGGSTSGCPTYRARTPIHVGSGHTLGERGGEQAHTLSVAELPTHTHTLNASSAAANASPPSPQNATILASSAPGQAFGAPTSLAPWELRRVTNIGGSQAHLNMQPFLTLSFCIALQGIFPAQPRRTADGTTLCR